MAEEILRPNGTYSGTGWTGTGSLLATSSDTGIASDSDGEGDVVRIDFDASGLSDGDTITDVSIQVRAWVDTDGGDESVTVDLVIGGTGQGGVAGTVGELSVSPATLTARSNVAWDTDWTAAQLDGLQVDITGNQAGMPTNNVWNVDTVWVVITYTPAASAEETTPSSGLNTTVGYAPTVTAETVRDTLPVSGLTEITGYAPDANASTYTQRTSLGLFGHGMGKHQPFSIKAGAASETSPSAGLTEIVGYAPTITLEVMVAVAPASGLISVAGYSPDITSEFIKTITPASGLVSTAGYAPEATSGTITQRTRLSVFGYAMGKYAGFSAKSGGSSNEVAPSAGLASTNGSIATVTLEKATQPASGLLEIAGSAPTIYLDKVSRPGSGIVSLSGYSPNVSYELELDVTPSAGLISVTGYVPIAEPGNNLRLNITRMGLFGVSAKPVSFVAKTEGIPEVKPSAGLLTTTGYTPTIDNDQIVEPLTGLITTTGYAPESGQQNAVAPASGLVSIQGQAPAVDITRYQVTRLGVFGIGSSGYPGFTAKGLSAQETRPSAGIVNAVGYVPTIIYDGERKPATGLITTTGYAPTIVSVGTGVVRPAVGLVTITSTAPQVSLGQRVRVTGLGLFGYGQGKYQTFAAKTASQIQETYPQTGLISTVGQVPINPISLTPAVGTVTIQGHLYDNAWFNADWFNSRWFTDKWFHRPTIVSTDIEYTPAIGSMQVVGNAPTVDSILGANTVGPSTGLVTIQGGQHTVSPGYTVTPQAGLIEISGKLPTMSKENGTWPETGLVSESGYAPDITVTRPVDLSPQLGLVDINGEIVSLTFGEIIREPVVGNIDISGGVPTVSTVFAFPGGGVISVSGYAPGVDTRRWVLEPKPDATWNGVSGESASWSTVDKDVIDCNLVPNGYFDLPDISEWLPWGNISLAVDSGRLKVSIDTTNQPSIYVPIPTTIGQEYTLSADFIAGLSSTTARGAFSLGAGTAPASNDLVFQQWTGVGLTHYDLEGSYSITFTATTTTTYLWFGGAMTERVAGYYWLLDNAYIQDLTECWNTLDEGSANWSTEVQATTTWS